MNIFKVVSYDSNNLLTTLWNGVKYEYYNVSPFEYNKIKFLENKNVKAIKNILDKHKYKKISSMKITKIIAQVILDLPDERQTFDYDCGAKAAQTVLAYYGIDIREDRLLNFLGTTEENGTNVNRIIDLFKKFGLQVKSGSLTIDELKSYIKSGYPVIMPIQAWTNDLLQVNWEEDKDDGHYVIAMGYKDDKIIFEDPAQYDKAYLTEEELEQRWHDFGEDGTKFDHLGIVVIGEKNYTSDKIVHMD